MAWKGGKGVDGGGGMSGCTHVVVCNPNHECTNHVGHVGPVCGSPHGKGATWEQRPALNVGPFFKRAWPSPPPLPPFPPCRVVRCVLYSALSAAALLRILPYSALFSLSVGLTP
jgi:hypothetical protein